MTGAFDDDQPAGALTGAKGLLGAGVPALFQEATVVVKAPVGTTLDSIPPPRPPAGDGALTPEEESALEACKAGLNNLHEAFWIAGKSLETMQVGNLHRNEGFPSFAEYVWHNWEISESQVYRLMDEWRIGEALSQLGHRPRESQVRKLAAVKRAAGDEAAVIVYDTVARAEKRVTAKLLHDVTRQLPPLSPETSPFDIQTMVREALSPTRESERGAAGSSPTGPGSGSDETGFANRTNGNLYGHSDSPIGESGCGEPGEQRALLAGDPADYDDEQSPDVRRLLEVRTLLWEASRSLTRVTVRQALRDAPDKARALVDEIDEVLGGIGETMSEYRGG
ncbi:hypothetical protein [Streptomyces sp. G45]|uniref:hypothetical protein n=1 Tax=Streptomyces sp. G45 TaxID=3406627 RepID=UPI003C1D41DB